MRGQNEDMLYHVGFSGGFSRSFVCFQGGVPDFVFVHLDAAKRRLPPFPLGRARRPCLFEQT